MANVNLMNFNQAATLLNAVYQQATGETNLAAANLSEFVSQAQTTLRTGYDPVLNAISNVLGRTIFSVRPYTRKFASLEVTEQQYGAHTRKLVALDKPFEEDDRIKLVDGQSIDQQRVNKPSVLQTNFYGQDIYQKSLTIFRDQLDVAFTGPEEFAQFVSMIMQNASDQMEQAYEVTARATIANFIGAKMKADPDNVIHLVSVYNADTGSSLTTATVRQPANFIPFTKWLYGYLKTLSGMMSERSVKYHMNLETADTSPIMIPRHTPVSDQRMYIYTPDINRMAASVLADVYHDNLLSMAEHEEVNYWQSINSPSQINVTPSYVDELGEIVASPTAAAVSNILGVVFDREAMGITRVNEWTANAPFNARGGYTNMYWHFTLRYWNDLTENAVVLLLDTAS